MSTDNIILWEYDAPLINLTMLNYSAGIWQWCITPGDITVTDDNGNTGYYSYTNSVSYNVKSLVIDGVIYLSVSSLNDLITQDESYYYDVDLKTIYITFTNYEPWLNQFITIGIAVGYANKDDNNGNVFSGNYYKPIVQSISGIKKSKDPLFYGLLKYNTGTVKLINTDGEFDSWRDQKSYRQPTRLLFGEVGDEYADFVPVGAGVIGEHTRSWDNFSIKFEDPRNVLSNKMPKNKLKKADWPNLSDSNVDAPKPIAYGEINNAPCICLNEEQSSSYYTFLLCDTEYNAVSALGTVKVNNVAVSVYSSNLAAGTFVLTSAIAGSDKSSVTASFTANAIDNGVDIIKDILKRYADTDYIDEYYDLVETAQAVTDCSGRNVALYIKEETDVKKALEKVCIDIDGLFFQHDDGLWTVRIYDSDRTPAQTIEFDEILEGSPAIDGNEDQFLSSVIIKYNKNQSTGSYSTYENTLYEAEVFAYYKALQTKTLETGLSDLASAQAKSESIMAFSKYIQDIVKIKVGFEFYDLEIMDFVICDPIRRRSGTEIKGVYEIIDINKDFNNFRIQLTLKYIKTYVPVVTQYDVRVTSTGEFRILSDGRTRMAQQ
jgi:hypothetical protein